MEAFAFRLERILQWRIKSMKTEEMRLEAIRISLEQARLENEKLAQAFLQAKQSILNNPVQRGVDLHTLASWSAHLDREIALAKRKISSLEETAAKQALVVATCDRNVRLLERLRGRRREEWQSAMNRELDDLAADFSTGQWLRKRQDARRSPEAV